MRIETCCPHLLPIQHLEWKWLIPLIGDAREAIARLDETLLNEKNCKPILEPLFWQESISSLRSQNIHTIFQKVIWDRFAEPAPEKRAARLKESSLQKKLLMVRFAGVIKGKSANNFSAISIARSIKIRPI